MPHQYTARLHNPEALGENDLQVDIVRRDDGGLETVIGQYVRNLGFPPRTFFPFEQNGRSLALYSPDYTATRVLELPSCRDLGGEEPDSEGFCPVEYFVPGPDLVGKHAGRIGFVYGCVWGAPFFVQFLDLSRAQQGVITRDDRLGQINIPTDADSLAQCIQFDPPHGENIWFHIRGTLTHHLKL